jgi:hypothetical protein
LSILGYIYGYDEKCATQGKYQCRTGETCCKGDSTTFPAGFFCVPSPNAECCSNGKMACPNGFKCASNSEPKCEKS